VKALESFAGNNKSVVFGNQSNNLLAQVDAFNMVQKQDSHNAWNQESENEEKRQTKMKSGSKEKRQTKVKTSVLKAASV